MAAEVRYNRENDGEVCGVEIGCYLGTNVKIVKGRDDILLLVVDGELKALITSRYGEYVDVWDEDRANSFLSG